MTSKIPKIIPLIDESGEVCAYVAKGEVTTDLMREAVRIEIGEKEPVTLYHIETRYFRWIPTPPGSEAGYETRLEVSKPGRGAWLGTYCEI